MTAEWDLPQYASTEMAGELCTSTSAWDEWRSSLQNYEQSDSHYRSQ